MDNIFGTRLKKLRTEQGYTQKELATLLGVSPSTVGMYEQGRREPENYVLTLMCRLLNTTPDYLIGFSKEKEKPETEKQEVRDVIDDFTKLLMSQQGLMFNGQPMTEEDREKIVIAIKSAAAIVIPNNINE